jgi:hypothetical protein
MASSLGAAHIEVDQSRPSSSVVESDLKLAWDDRFLSSDKVRISIKFRSSRSRPNSGRPNRSESHELFPCYPIPTPTHI